MPKPRLFISHASASLAADARVARVREALYEKLSGDWDVFLDRHVIGGGQRWRAEILEGLASAQAAVVLFDQRATNDSKWVRAEALVLCFKKSRDPSFQLVPVLFDGQKLGSTAFADYEPFELNEIQAISDDPQASPEDVRDRIAACFDVNRAKGVGARRGWVEEMFGIVKDDANALQLAAEQLEIDCEKLAGAEQAAFVPLLRRAVVQHLHQEASLANRLSALTDLMTPLSVEGRARFVEYIYAKWVPNRAVEILLGAARAPAKRGLVALNTTNTEVLEHYELRARIEMKPIVVRWVGVSDAAGDDDDSLVRATKASLKATLFRPGLLLDESTEQELSLEESVKKLLARGGIAVVCTLPPRFAKQAVLDRLRSDFEGVVFLITKKTAAELGALALKGVVNLNPLLDARLLNELTEVKVGLSA